MIRDEIIRPGSCSESKYNALSSVADISITIIERGPASYGIWRTIDQAMAEIVDTMIEAECQSLLNPLMLSFLFVSFSDWNLHLEMANTYQILIAACVASQFLCISGMSAGFVNEFSNTPTERLTLFSILLKKNSTNYASQAFFPNELQGFSGDHLRETYAIGQAQARDEGNDELYTLLLKILSLRLPKRLLQ